ncbi:MAG TPA: DUF3109 family protein [Candidatus Kryptobacter bacterium]|nr:MAG: hypothetical protein B7Z63_04200 [Ignavibacteriae bacterium 37-53-5]HQT92697.1 DUF3109 family protein [Candidatus Kryptobacter bacterium]
MRELFVIEDVAVDGSLVERKFACDLLKCKGACCSLPGGRGAPLLDSEIPEMEAVLPEVLPLLSEEKRRAIEKSGFYEGPRGDYATTCIDDEDCVFVYRENGIAKCAIERAFNDGKTGFRKPISCHLYPIRINRFGGDILRYHEIAECKPAVKKGESENVGVIEFLKPPLTRMYGEEWYGKLEIYAGLKPVERI